MQRQRETELKRTLRELRSAIDDYKDAVDLGLIGGTEIDPSNGGYPPSLEVLVEGVETTGQGEGIRRFRFLRDNIYDVHTTSRGTALDGTLYRDW